MRDGRSWRTLPSLSFWPAGPSFCLPHLWVVCGWQGCGNRPGLRCPRALAHGGGRGPVTWWASLAVALSWAVAAEPCLCASLYGAPGAVQVVPQVPEAEWWCCSRPPSAFSRVSLLPVSLGSLGGVEAVRQGETRACFASLEGGCRCRAAPTCVCGESAWWAHACTLATAPAGGGVVCARCVERSRCGPVRPDECGGWKGCGEWDW